MADAKNLELPREGLIRQTITSYEQSSTSTGLVMVRAVTRHYYENGENYIDHSTSEPIVMLHGHPTDDSMRKK